MVVHCLRRRTPPNPRQHAIGVMKVATSCIAEALERGKSVITTDGAPAWKDWSSSASSSSRKEENHHSSTSTSTSTFTYLTGYREGDDKTRVQLLKSALQQHLPPPSHIAISDEKGGVRGISDKYGVKVYSGSNIESEL